MKGKLGELLRIQTQHTQLMLSQLSNEELQKILSRPFKGSLGNSWFDSEKWCANLLLNIRSKL